MGLYTKTALEVSNLSEKLDTSGAFFRHRPNFFGKRAVFIEIEVIFLRKWILLR